MAENSPENQTNWRAPVERLRGMNDVRPHEVHARQAILHRLHSIFRQHGYRPVDTPVVEPTELFLRKSGGERISQMYAVNFRDRDISLRPEFTASILRYYADHHQSDPLPVRLHYNGPVFRYERPQAGRSRQFTEVGCELLGGTGPAADAEVIHLATKGLNAIGVDGTIVLGHIGLVLDYLNRLPLRQRARDWLLWSMDRLRLGQTVDFERDLSGLVSRSHLGDIFNEMGTTFDGIPPEQLEHWALAILREVGMRMEGGTRTPEEIVAGVIAKMNQSSDEADVRRAFEFISELVMIKGDHETVLPELRGLVRRHDLSEEPINEIERTLEILGAYGHSAADDIELNLGLGRGLHYYTGILFEIHSRQDRSLQLCGGGRYDELAQTIGARHPIPACGFSYGLERIVQAATVEVEQSAVEYLVAPVSPDAVTAAVQACEQLRDAGHSAEIDVRQRSENANRRYAVRQGIKTLCLVDSDGSVERIELNTAEVRSGGDNE